MKNTGRDINKRAKCFGIPIETCVRYDRMAGTKPGEKPTRGQSVRASELMIDALVRGAVNVELAPEDYERIAEEVRKNKEERENN